MSSTFTGFSEEDLKKMKSVDPTKPTSGLEITDTAAKVSKIGLKQKRPPNPYRLPNLKKPDNDDLDKMFEKCKLSLKTPTPTSPPVETMNIIKNFEGEKNSNHEENVIELPEDKDSSGDEEHSIKQNISYRTNSMASVNSESSLPTLDSRKNSIYSDENRRSSSVTTPDIVRCIDNYTEDDLAAHKAKLADLQLKQKLMEEQNKQRKEMLARALADRTKQTEEEVMRLEKIKKELQILDSQFSQDVAVLRRKIDHACLNYAEAEKHYLKIEKEFLQAKINLQKAKEQKELLTEHLCTLITHNETRKAKKLENLMLELATDIKESIGGGKVEPPSVSPHIDDIEDEKPVIIDGVDEKTGKMVEFTS